MPDVVSGGGKPSILLVDDEEAILKLLSLTLELQGLEVVSATNGNDAWIAAQQRSFDLVITDSVMPQVERLVDVRNHLKCPVVLMSGASGPLTERIAERLQAVAFLQKPIAIKELIDVVRSLLPDVSL